LSATKWQQNGNKKVPNSSTGFQCGNASASEHPLNDNYLSMVSQAMGGRGNLEESENKIIRRIAKTVYIDKY